MLTSRSCRDPSTGSGQIIAAAIAAAVLLFGLIKAMISAPNTKRVRGAWVYFCCLNRLMHFWEGIYR